MSKVWMDVDDFLALDDKRDEERVKYKLLNTAELKGRARRRKRGEVVECYDKIIRDLPLDKKFSITYHTHRNGLATGPFKTYLLKWCSEHNYTLQTITGQNGGCIIHTKGV